MYLVCFIDFNIALFWCIFVAPSWSSWSSYHLHNFSNVAELHILRLDKNQVNGSLPRSATWFPYRKFQGAETLSPVPFHPHLAPRSCTLRIQISRKIFFPVAFLHPFSVGRCCRSWTCTGTASTNLFLGTGQNSWLSCYWIKKFNNLLRWLNYHLLGYQS